MVKFTAEWPEGGRVWRSLKKKKKKRREKKRRRKRKGRRKSHDLHLSKGFYLKICWEKNLSLRQSEKPKTRFPSQQLSLTFDSGVHKLSLNLLLMSNEIWRGRIMAHTSHSLSFVIISISEWLQNVSSKSGDKSVGIESYRLTVGGGCMPEAWLS